MIAVDTNVVVRFLVDDDHEQAARARSLIAAEQLSISHTVLLETAWVLRSYYRFQSRDIIGALRAFLSLKQVTLRDRAGAERALDWADQGLDIADAFHLTAAVDCRSFASFDRDLARQVARHRIRSVVRIP